MDMAEDMANAHEPPDQRQASAPRLFLSYTRTDSEAAKRIISVLEEAGFDVWWDGLIEGGVNYLPMTEAALEEADCVVVLWSRQAVESGWVRDEAQRGRERGCLVPVSLDGTMSPLGFRQIQLLDISGWSGKADAPEMARVLAAVRRTVSGAGDPPERRAMPAQAAPPAAPPPPRAALAGGVSRRGLAIGGGAALLAGVGVLGAWQAGLFGGAGGGAVSMAVLPFANLTGDEEQGWFSAGLSNELRQALARNPRLRVSAPTSSAAAADGDEFALASRLGVENILRGSVQRAADMVRIFVELVEVDGGVVRWSESYDRPFADVFAMQSEIAETVALSLVARIAGREGALRSVEQQQGVGGTDDPAAYEDYLRGLALSELSSGVESDRAALTLLEAAVASDPAFAAAHAMRATMLAAVANASESAAEVERFYDLSIAAAERAIALAPELARGHLALGFALNNGRLDRAGAAPHYRRAQELAPGDADTQASVAIFFAFGDQQPLAMQMIDRVLELDPLNPLAFRTAGFIALLARDYSATISRMMQALKLNPGLASAHFAIGNARLMQGDTAGAQAAFEQERVPLFSQVGLAITLARLGDEARARAALAELVGTYGDAGLYQQAQVHAQWGDADRALDLLERAYDMRDPGMLFARNDALLDPLRSSPRFERLLLRLSS